MESATTTTPEDKKWSYNRDLGHDVMVIPPIFKEKNDDDWKKSIIDRKKKLRSNVGFFQWLASFDCWSLRNSVIVIGLLSVFVHILEFFAYVYLATAFYLLKYDKTPKSSNIWWTYGYPGLLALHSCIQVSLSMLLIAGAIMRKKSYVLPYIISTVIECFLLLKSSILLAYYAEPATLWIVATTVAFFSVQVFYAVCVIALYRRLKKQEKEIQPPDYRLHF